MTNVGFVIPIYKDTKSLREAVPNIQKYYPESKIIVVADDLESMNVAKELGVFVPYHSKKIGFGKSLCEGLCAAWFTFNCDSVVIADGDHPFEAVDRFLKELSNFDVVVGYEGGKWKRSRVWSNKLVSRFLFNDVSNPTCGFQVWKGSILSKIPWGRVRSDWDMVHPELLFWAKKCGGKITECSFDEVDKVRYYSPRRYVSWALSFIRLLKVRYMEGGL